jgi:histone-lysine N-methyltransferase SUV39H
MLTYKIRFYNRYNRNYVFDIDFWYLGQIGKRALYAIDAMHVGCFTRFFNHSCDPNAVIVPCIFGDADEETPYLAFFAHRNIPAGEEITFSYKGDVPDPEPVGEVEVKKARKKPQANAGNPSNNHKINVLCLCGSKNCNGSLWNWDNDDDEEESSPDELAGSD